MDFLIPISIALMVIFVLSKIKILGGIGWILFSLEWITRLPHFLEINDYFNSTVVFLAFIFFAILGITILKDKGKNLQTFIDITAFSALASLIYFPFAISNDLGFSLIAITADLTAKLSNLLGFGVQRFSENTLVLNDHYIEIILACTGIESMALFAGATLGIRADFRRKVVAFLISVPVIYILNLLRNVFVIASFGYSWFGENSFYIAHHIISKILATIALILISLAVFRILPELADLIYRLKDVLEESYRGQKK
jgi:archaeosortase A (PGF-CTERM-specific)